MRAALVIIGLFAFAAVSAAAEKTPEEMAREIRARPVPQSVFQKNPDGSALHLQSGLQCPAAAADLRLSETLVVDGFGFDVACNYEGSGPIISVYLTERGDRPLQQHYDLTVAAIKQRWPQVTPYDNPPAPSARPWLSALYTKDDTNHRSGVWIADFAGWTLKFRATYPAGQDDLVFAALRELAATAERTALVHLDACAKSPPPRRSAIIVDDKEKLRQMAMTSIAVQGMTAEGVQTGWDDSPPIWCAEARIVKDQVPLLLWRNIASGSTFTDRITPMTVGKSPVFESMISPAAAMTLHYSEPGKPFAKGILHQLVFTNDNGSQIFAIYDGRPDGETLAQLAADIIHDKARPIAGYDPKTRKMNIYVGN
jgi:hypothetical protein